MIRISMMALFAIGCSGAGLGETSPDGQAPGGSADLAPAQPPGPDMGLPSVSFSIGPIDLAPGEETTMCTIFRLPTTEPIDVVRIDSTLAPGSHHLIFYKSNLTTEQTSPMKCAPLDIGFGGGAVKNIPIYISETATNNELNLPTGAAYHFEAGQMLKLEAHYLNASPNAIKGVGSVKLLVGPKTQTYQPAAIMFCGSVFELATTGVPPGMTTLRPGFYSPPAGTKVFGLTAHQHQRGTLMTIGKSTGAPDPGTLLVNGTPWDNEPFIRYDDAHLLTFSGNEGLRWDCTYDNPTNMTFKFGESAATNEMCFMWAYYYPSVGHFISQECLR